MLWNMDLLMYPLLYAVSYSALYVLLPLLQDRPVPRPGWASVISVIGIAVFIESVFILTSQMTDRELGNRLLHIMGGGVLGFMLYARVVSDTRIPFNRLQFFVYGVLIVSTLGVLNEHLEFFLQATGTRVFMWSITDTWLDLASNSLGTVLVGLPLTFVHQSRIDVIR